MTDQPRIAIGLLLVAAGNFLLFILGGITTPGNKVTIVIGTLLILLATPILVSVFRKKYRTEPKKLRSVIITLIIAGVLLISGATIQFVR
jgi:Na+-translocating ferredoxin:NAD+ oxidoreductase RnfE subunit